MSPGHEGREMGGALDLLRERLRVAPVVDDHQCLVVASRPLRQFGI